jgi:hypothetical protein
VTTDLKAESELQRDEYLATREELQIIDAVMASIDAGETASDAEIEVAFAKFQWMRKVLYFSDGKRPYKRIVSPGLD